MDIYHFLKYERGFSFEELFAKNKTDAVLCFDFEDSIQDILNPENTSRMKAVYRQLFWEGFQKISSPFNAKTAVRINSAGSGEYQKDLMLLSSIKYIHSVFLPKTNGPEDIKRLIQDLNSNHISCSEIIPVIETKRGLLNLQAITQIDSDKIKRIAFGHCDYNADAGIFPFLHQNSREYWNWVEKFFEVLKNTGIRFLNSPFLELNDDENFIKMLSGLQFVFGNQFDQITLNYRQSEHCRLPVKNSASGFRKLPNRLHETNVYSFAENFVHLFEEYNVHKGFSVTGSQCTLLSPQEYTSAKNYLNTKDNPEIRFTFVGGCFPVQGSICYEDLFHQLIKSKLERKHKIKLRISIIRYEQLYNCPDKIKNHHENDPTDILVFCFRPEPVLRLTKLTYRGIMKNGEINRCINLPLLIKNANENYDLLPVDFLFSPKANGFKTKKRGLLKSLNYLLGAAAGNFNFVFSNYLRRYDEISDYCNHQNIKLITMGPAVKNDTFTDSYFSAKFAEKIKQHFENKQCALIRGCDSELNGIPLFHANGIHANEMYHQLIAQRLTDQIEPIISNIISNKEKQKELVLS